jgi:hypothetical protein
MPRLPFTTFSKPNRRLILLLVTSHFLWSCAVFGLWSTGYLSETASAWWTVGLIALQLFAAAQMFLPALRLHPEDRTRSFYLFWGIALLLIIWLANQITPSSSWLPLLTAIKSGLLLLIATIVGTALARYVRRLWELIPICLAMTLADFVSWSFGPTADFARQIQQYYMAPEGPPPLIDMLLIKLALPGAEVLAPVFGISDWIMVVFFAVVAKQHGVNDNLLGMSNKRLLQHRRIGCYLPISVVALFAAILLAQTTGLFIPALPVIALIVFVWYAARYLQLRRSKDMAES